MALPGFGWGIGDVFSLLALVSSFYGKCKHAPAEFTDLRHTLHSLKSLLREIHNDISNPRSHLSRSNRTAEVYNLLHNLRNTNLQEVDELIKKHHSLGTSNKRFRDRVRFGHKGFADIRHKLQSHVVIIQTTITHINGQALSRLEHAVTRMDQNQTEMRELLHQVFQQLRDGSRTVLSTTTTVWEEMRNQLLAEGISDEFIEQHKEEIKEYIRQLVRDGAFGSVRTGMGNDHDDEGFVEGSGTDDDTIDDFDMQSLASTNPTGNGIFATPLSSPTLRRPQENHFPVDRNPMTRGAFNNEEDSSLEVHSIPGTFGGQTPRLKLSTLVLKPMSPTHR
jgi:hypothetical protein